MGWSHGGYITLLSMFREKHPFAAGAAIVPVTNLLFRLSLKGPSYQWDFATQKRIQGLPFEKPDIYIERSPLYHVDKLQVPLLVHVSTNDLDVNYVEDQQIVDALRSRKPDLAETRTYVDPAPWGATVGHSFSRRVDPKTLQRVDSPDADRFVEPDVDVLRLDPAAVRGSIEGRAAPAESVRRRLLPLLEPRRRWPGSPSLRIDRPAAVYSSSRRVR